MKGATASRLVRVTVTPALVGITVEEPISVVLTSFVSSEEVVPRAKSRECPSFTGSVGHFEKSNKSLGGCIGPDSQADSEYIGNPLRKAG